VAFLFHKLMHNALIFVFLAFATLAPAQEQFPASWSGDWKGTLEIFNGAGKVQSVEMTLELHKIDSSKTGRYTFGIVYGSKKTDYRPYELVPVAPEKGLWKVDEKNSIAMESYLYGPKLLCWFVVEGNRVLCTYEKIDEKHLVFEVLAGKETPVSNTGDTMLGEEKIPPVISYPFSAFQRAMLTKQ
jgi:hypothetical protein